MIYERLLSIFYILISGRSVHVEGRWTLFLSEATERRAAIDRKTSPSQLPAAVLTLERMTSHRRIEEAFHCKLKGPVVADKKTLVELQNYQTVSLFKHKCVCL